MGVRGPMVPPRLIFSESGPLDLTFVDWENLNHRRCVASSLVQGVYVLELDRQQKRQGPHAIAPPWWDFFQFQLIRILVDDADLTIFGAVYEFKFPLSCGNLVQNPPLYIIAFRGTIMEPVTRSQDIKLGLQFFLKGLQQSTRFQLAMQTVQSMVSIAGASNIWLAGHSLGSAIALLAGKKMVKMGCFIESYLFNPPFPPAKTGLIKNQKLTCGIRFASSVSAGVAVALNGLRKRPLIDDSFLVLSEWFPYLFVNPYDLICADYIRYFEQMKKMAKISHASIARLLRQNSLQSLYYGALGKDSETSHLLPSAYLITNLSSGHSFKQAHGIQQWWKEKIHCQLQQHQFRKLYSMNLRQRLFLDMLYDNRVMKQSSTLAEAKVNDELMGSLSDVDTPQIADIAKIEEKQTLDLIMDKVVVSSLFGASVRLPLVDDLSVSE